MKISFGKRTLTIAFLASACGGDAKQVVTPQPTASITPPATHVESGARWVFVTPASGIRDKLDLENKTMLLVGEHGRRETVRDGTAQDAEILAPDTLFGLMRDDQHRFVFVSDEAATYISRDPLGPFETFHKGPADEEKHLRLWHTCSGRAAILASLSDSRLVRTADFGATWNDVTYAAGPKLFGHPARFDMGHDGSGVLLHVPQRLFATHDDGATWTPIVSPANGMRATVDDVSGTFFVEGYDHTYMKLVGDALVPTDEVPKGLASLSVAGARSAHNFEVMRVVAGDHVVELERSQKAGKHDVRVRSTKLGSTPGSFVAAPDLKTTHTIEDRVAGYGSNLIFLRTDDDADENTPTSTIFTSGDSGVTWKADQKLDGAETTNDSSRIVVGPKGWAFIPALCSSRGQDDCATPKIRKAGASTFEDMILTEEFTPLKAFAFDEAHDKVYVAGTKAGDAVVYESRLSQNRFSPLKDPIIVDASSQTLTLTVNGDGALHAFHYDGSLSAMVLERRDASGKKLPTLYLPSKKLTEDQAAMAFAGARGVLMNGESFGWETADGGVTWSRVAANGSSNPQCSESGCLLGETQRVGWDLPMKEPAREIVTALDAMPVEHPDPDPNHKIVTAPPAMNIACKVSGAGTVIATDPTFDNMNESRDVRWVVPDYSHNGTAVVVGGRSTTHRVVLLDSMAPTPKNPIIHSDAQRWLNDGFVAARYTYKEGEPVDVELAAFALETGHAQHAKLPKLPNFRVPNYGFTGDTQLVTGGLLYQSTDSAPLFFIHENGKVDRMTTPAHTVLSQAQHVGNSWLLFDTNDRKMAHFDWSTDNGATWQQRAWLVTDASDANVSMLRSSHPWISTNLHEGLVLYPLTASMPTEVPMPVVPDTSAFDAVCDAHGAYASAFLVATHGGTVHASVDLNDKKPAGSVDLQQRIMHVTASGALCTTGFVFTPNQSPARVALYHDGKAFTGWSFRAAADGNGRLAEPLTCTVSSP